MTKELGISKDKVTRHALLDDIFPKQARKNMFKIIGDNLNIEISYFQSSGWFQLTAVVFLLFGFILLFFNPLFGGLLLISTLFITFISHKLSRNIPMKTFGEFVDRLTRDNIIKLQADRNSINNKDIRMTVIKLIDDLHALDKLDVGATQKIIFE